jgi:hypothetical protein
MGSSGLAREMRQVTERWVSQDSVQQDDRYVRVFLVDSSEASDHRHEPVLKHLRTPLCHLGSYTCSEVLPDMLFEKEATDDDRRHPLVPENDTMVSWVAAPRER